MHDKLENQEAAREPDAQSCYVDERVPFSAQQVTDGDFEIVGEHGG